MKSFVHPLIEDVQLEAIFYALGSGVRLKIVANLYQAQKSKTTKLLTCSQSTAGLKSLPPSTLSHHFRILREGGLVHSQREGKECLNTLRLEELEARFPNVLKSILKCL